ncbi:putative hemagglutinin protein (FhaB), partial [Moraxella catarrhalis 101P30B1]
KQQGQSTMNRFCYRVIFNKNLGRLVVVSEITKAQGKSGNLGGGLGKKPTWLSISLMTKLAPLTIACWLGCSGSAFANVISDSQAPVFQRPIIAAAKNDRQQTVALVQIQTPVQGISHNKYTQFDVPNQGIVLNNARTGASTQLVGAVAANPFLKQGEAHTIVNEVRSSKASQLAGSIEVAGQKANLVIANPSGITVTGAGFINVHEATLSTGQAINKQGHIHHTVNKGAIVIQTPKSANVATQTTTNNIGLGGPNKNADLVNLYSKTANINAQVQAEYAITTVTGTNQISDVGQVTPITSNQTTTNTTKPTTAIDIKSLGGMTAGSISLVGTDKGFGVNQAGSLNAKQAITITADGKITHSGQSSVQQGVVSLKSNTAVGLNGSTSNKTTIWASKDIAMIAPTIMANHASLNSASNITLQAKQELGTNNTTIHAGKKIEAIVFDNPAPKNTNGAASFTNTTFTTQGALTTANLQGNLTHNQSIIDAAGNVSSFAKGQQTLDHTNITSQANIQIQANSDLIVNNSQINSAKHTTIYVQGNQTTTSSTLIAKGIVSDVVKGDHRINGNGTYQGGAVLLDSTSLTLNGRLIARTTKSPLLNSNKNAQVLNGSLSIQTDRALTLNSTNHNLAIGGDISLVSQQGKLTLQNTNPVTNGNQAHYTLNAHQGNLTLQGSEVQLQGVNLKSKNNLTVYATQGSVVMDGVKREFSNKNQSGSDQKRALEAKLDEAARLSLTTRADAFTNTKSRIENQLGILNSNSTGFIHTPTTLVSQAGDIGVYAKQGILSQGALLNAVSGNITLEAQGVLPFAYQQTTKSSQSGSSNQSDAETQTDKAASIILTGSQNRYEIGQDGNDHHRLLSFGSPSMLTAGRDIDIRATKAATDKQDETPTLVLQGTKAKANGAIDIRANHHLLLDVGIDFEYSYDKTTRKHGRWYRRKYTTTETTNEWVDADVVELTAGDLRLQTTGNNSNNDQKHHLDIYGAELNTTGNITLGASGNINLYATKDTHTIQQNNQTKKKFLGIKTGTSNSKYNFSQIAAVPASLSAQFISSRSKGDTLLEGTRFEYLKGAQISAGGKIRLLAALSELQTATQREDNWVVWQRTQGEGQHTQTAQLPSFTGTAAPMFEAQGGLNIQIPISEKDVQKRQLKDEIITLASQPQYSYLNDLVNRNDVDWQQIILTDKDWDYKQQGLTPAGAAIVAIAVAYATGGVGTALTSTVATATGSTTLGTMTSAAFSSLVTQASISLIDNQGNIKQTLKDLGSKQNIKQMTFAIASAGIGSKINQTLSKSLSVGDIANSHNFSHKISKGIANATSTALLESTIYGTSLEKSLIKNLRGEVANAVASEVFTDYVKPLDKDTLIDNITHKLAAGLTGCLSAKAAGNRCEAGSIGAVVGEMWGDYQVDDPNTLTQAQKDKLINQAKLIAGITAAFAGEDVNVAAGVAAEAVEN